MRSKRIKTTLGIAILIVTAIFGLSLSAYAFSGELSGTALLFSYYDARSLAEGGLGLTDNYYAVTNSSTHWVQAHVRVRTSEKSVELLDFDVLISPIGMFTFDLYENPRNNAMTFASCNTRTLIDSGFTLNFDRATGKNDANNDCYILDSSTFPAMLSLIQTCEPNDTPAQVLLDTKSGYVEVIEEGIIVPCSVDNTTCSGPAAVAPDDGSATDACGTTKAVSIPGKTLLNSHPTLSLATSPTGVAGQCNASVFAPNGFTPSTGELEGRIYYAQVNQTTGDVQRLATLNAEVLNDNLSETITTLNYTTTNVAHGPILHYESYPLELASQECLPAGVAGFPCYAYVAASTKAPANGDQVLNWCTYTDTTGSPATGVFNKFGAAATFGPTLVDLNVVRDTTLATTAGALNQLVRNFSLGYSAFTGFDFDVVTKTFADTHYFATPAPEIYDMNTGFSFSFPLQHFIGEADVISVNAIYDTLENTTVVPLGKFISPGLPTVESPSNEVTLQFISNPPFSEGWIRFQPLAVNATGSCTTQGGTGAIAGDPCGVIGFLPNGLNTVAANPSTPYVPGYSAAVFVTGANELSASLFQFSAELLAE